MSKTCYDWLVDRQPTHGRYTIVGDVAGSVQIGVNLKSALPAPEVVAVPVPLVDMAADGTLLRGVTGVNEYDQLAHTFGFVPDELLQLIERPRVDLPVEISAAALLNSNPRQVFESEHGEWGGYDLLRYAVVGISHKPSLSAGHLPEFPAGGPSAFGLKFGAEIGVFRTSVLHTPVVEKGVVGTDRDVHDSPINTENRTVAGRLRRSRFDLAMEIKSPIATPERDRGRLDPPCQIFPVVFRERERCADAAVRCGDRGVPRLQENADHIAVVSHRRKLAADRLNSGFNGLKGLARTISRTLNQRRREIGNRLSNIPVGGMVAIHLVRGAVLEPPRGTMVERHGVIPHGCKKGRAPIGLDIKFDLDCPNHSHIWTAMVENSCGCAIQTGLKTVNPAQEMMRNDF